MERESESAHSGYTAPQRCAGAYGRGCMCVCICKSAVCGNEGMGKRRESRSVCGEEDTWDRGSLPHPMEPPPPVAMQLCEGREDATAWPLRCSGDEKPYKGLGITNSFSFVNAWRRTSVRPLYENYRSAER